MTNVFSRKVAVPQQAVLTLATRLSLIALTLPALAGNANAQQQGGSVAIAIADGATYTQNFNTLASTGATGSVLPDGWAFHENGGTNATTYIVNNGSNNAGNTYSYGATGSDDRAFGMLGSGTIQSAIGAVFANTSSLQITGLDIAFTSELWRRGDTTAEAMPFGYSFTATALRTGTYTALTALDMTPRPGEATPTGGARNGNDSANQAARNASLTGLNWNTNSTLWIRWVDANSNGNDDGIAVDDFSLVATGFSAVANTTLSSGNFAGKTIVVQDGVNLDLTGGTFNTLSVLGLGRVNLVGSGFGFTMSATGTDGVGTYTDYLLSGLLGDGTSINGLTFRDYAGGGDVSSAGALFFNGIAASAASGAVAPEPGSLALLLLTLLPATARIARTKK